LKQLLLEGNSFKRASSTRFAEEPALLLTELATIISSGRTWTSF
jgi:hypothetical protein